MLKVLLIVMLGLSTLPAGAQSSVPAIGVVSDLENAGLLHDLRFAYLLETTPKILSPRNVSDEQFEALLPRIQSSATPVYGCNIFIPGDLKVVGPEIREEAVLAYVDTVLQRAQRAGMTLITWGSSGSRRVPDGFSRVQATAQFVDMARKVSEVAAKYDMLLVLENLNSTEANFITSVPEALAVVKAVNHPNFRLCVDIYHMLVDGQPATDIVGVGEWARYSELAEAEGRTPPGVHGTDFTPYLRAMREEGYTGNFMIEARWDDLAAQGPSAYRTLRDQVDVAYE